MARIRTIKPEFWSDEKLTECSLSARLTFIGLWSFADDEGRMEFQPVRLRMQIYPCGTVALNKLSEYFGELTERSLIRRYLVDGKEFLDIPGFAKHQRINRPTPSRLPEYVVSDHGGLTESSLREGKGTGTGTGTGNGSHDPSASKVLSPGAGAKQPSPPKARKSAKTPIPDGFSLDPELLAYVTAKIPDANATAMFESFCGDARAKGWAYVDWRQAWQTYVRNCAPNSGHWASGQYPKSGAGATRWM